MKKTLLLFVLLVISTTSYAREEYYFWGKSLNNGGIKSKVAYPKEQGFRAWTFKVNPSSYGKYIGFSIFLKTTNVHGSAYQYINLVNKEEKVLRNIKGKKIKGTKGWKRYYTPPVYVSSDVTSFVLGVSLHGTGKVEFYDYIIEEYSYK
jgi:hypothetical protein